MEENFHSTGDQDIVEDNLQKLPEEGSSIQDVREEKPCSTIIITRTSQKNDQDEEVPSRSSQKRHHPCRTSQKRDYLSRTSQKRYLPSRPSQKRYLPCRSSQKSDHPSRLSQKRDHSGYWSTGTIEDIAAEEPSRTLQKRGHPRHRRRRTD